MTVLVSITHGGYCAYRTFRWQLYMGVTVLIGYLEGDSTCVNYTWELPCLWDT